MMSLKEAYCTLGAKRSDNLEKIKHIYRNRVRSLHPDLNPTLSCDMISKVNVAYDIIKEYLSNNNIANNDDFEVDDEELSIIAQKLDASISELRNTFNVFKKTNNYSGNILDYYNDIISKYYDKKNMIIDLYKQLHSNYNGGLLFVITQYLENTNKDISIEQWLTSLVKTKEMCEKIGTKPAFLHKQFILDQEKGYNKEFLPWLKTVSEDINILSESGDNYVTSLYKYWDFQSNGYTGAFVDYLEQQVLYKKYNCSAEEIILKLYHIARNEGMDSSLAEYIGALMGEFDRDPKTKKLYS